MTKLGAHVQVGPRNGYGQFVQAKPRLIVAVGEGGALREAKEAYPGCITVYRDISVYLEAPPDFKSGDPVASAEHHWPLLRRSWAQNPADYYTMTNEQGGGGDDLEAIRWLVDYERALMRLANEDGYKVAVLNLGTGSPDFDVWAEEMAPFIVEAWRAGNAYGRHVYGDPHLIRLTNGTYDGPTDPVDRLSDEMDHLDLDLDACGPILLTEVGLYAGFNMGSCEEFVSQLRLFDAWCRLEDRIVGIAMWALGDWPYPTNWMGCIPQFVEYMNMVDTPSFTGVDCDQMVEPPHDEAFPRVPYSRVYWVVDGDLPEDERIRLYTKAAIARQTAGPGYDDAGLGPVGGADGLKSKTAILTKKKPEDMPEFEVWYKKWYPSTIVRRDTSDDGIIQPPPSPLFRFTHWPTEYRQVNMNNRWGANPQSYQQFGLPGHEGSDIVAPHGSKIFSVAPGEVIQVRTDPEGHNYGIHVRVQHQDGYQTIYGHMLESRVAVGQQVAGGELLGMADNTGNSFGSHLHLTLKRLGYTFEDKYGVWPYNIHNPEPYLMQVAPEAFNEGTDEGYTGPPLLFPFSPGIDQPAADWAWPGASELFNLLPNLAVKFHTPGVNIEYWPVFKHDARMNPVRVVIDRGFTNRDAYAIFMEMRDEIQRFYDRGARDFIVLNEPNTTHEHLGKLWDTPEEFGGTYRAVTALVRHRFPEARVWAPGFSPGGTDSTPVHEKPQHDFIRRARAAGAFDFCYGMTQHVYTGITHDSHAALLRLEDEIIDFQIQHALNRPMLIGEFSINRPAPADYKAWVYMQLFDLLKKFQGVQGAYSFTASWAGSPDPNDEGWVEHGIHNAFAEMGGGDV